MKIYVCILNITRFEAMTVLSIAKGPNGLVMWVAPGVVRYSLWQHLDCVGSRSATWSSEVTPCSALFMTRRPSGLRYIGKIWPEGVCTLHQSTRKTKNWTHWGKMDRWPAHHCLAMRERIGRLGQSGGRRLVALKDLQHYTLFTGTLPNSGIYIYLLNTSIQSTGFNFNNVLMF